MSSKSPPPIVKPATTDNVKQQTTFYASPLAQHRSLVDVAGRCSPQPPRYSSRPQSPPTSSPSVEPKVRNSKTNDSRGHRYDYDSPSSRDRERDIRREQSPLPRIVSNESSSTPSSTVGSLESALNNYSLYSRRALSPRPMLGNKALSGETSAPTSFDSEHLRSISRSSPNSHSHQRSNSAEGQQSYKRWGPYTSPVPIHRMQQKPYIPTNLSSKDDSNADGKQRQLPPFQLQNTGEKMNVDKKSEEAGVNDDEGQHAGSKRKDREEDSREQNGTEQSEVSDNHSHFSSLAPPSSHLYGDMGAARGEKIRSANSADQDYRKGRRPSEGMQEQDELEDDSDEARCPVNRTNEGVVLALAPQRKSCDRCFKMKTKCSRAAPGASGEEPCDGCVRRGFGNDCITSRPDYPYPRISLPKRARRESSLPALLDLNNKDAAVYVPSSMQRSNDWRTKLIVNSVQRGSSEDLSRNNMQQQKQQIVQHSMAGKRSVTPQPLPLRSQPSHYPSNPSTNWQMYGQGNKEAPSSNASRSHASHLRTLATSELQDLSLRIAHEVTQRSQPPSLPLPTPIVPSIPISSHSGKPQHSSQQLSNIVRTLQPSGGSLGQQAMQNAPMQLLPKATGLPALHYFDQFIYPFYSLSALSATVLLQKYEDYIKPGRNNILELAMAIGLQLQGILLACPDKSQVNTAEGRILKAYLETKQPEQRSTLLQQGEKCVPPTNESRVSFDSIKVWIDPSRHRSRAKDIVKHVMMRRCLKSGFDYDDVVETSLLSYYYLLRGDVSSFYVYIGNAQRQVALLDIQQNPRDAALWSTQDMRILQAKAITMDHLQPISFFSHVSSPFFTARDKLIDENNFVLIQEKLSEVASFVQTQTSNNKKLGVEVDDRLTSIKKSLPSHVQLSIRSEWFSKKSDRVDNDWISDMIRGESMTPSLRINIYLNICFLRLVARQSCLAQALDDFKVDVKDSIDEKEDMDTLMATLDEDVLQIIRQVNHISSSMMSSILLAFTVFPHLICLSQLFAAELSASAWNYTISQLLLLNLASKEQHQEAQDGLKRMQDKLTAFIEYLNASQEKESWPFASSLETVKSIIQAARQDQNGAKKWLNSVHSVSKSHNKVFTRLLKGDTCAVEEFRKQTVTPIIENTAITPNT